MPETFSFGVEPVTCHAWNGDRSCVAVSLNNDEVHIYRRNGASYEKISTLLGHAQRVTGIDWAPKSNRIVTCGSDRNAHVWKLQDGTWKPTLVILRINRAATCVKWSPSENKFAVGSGARIISVCYFDDSNDWWVSKQIKKPIRSTITSLDWHPNDVLLACGATDFTARVFSAYIKEIDPKPEATCWGKKMTFGQLMMEFHGDGWIHDVSLSMNGDKLAWVGHDSSLSVVDAASEFKIYSIQAEYLPFLSVIWSSENSLIVVGHDCCPMLYNYKPSGEITFAKKLDEPKQKQGGKFSALSHFKKLDTQAQSGDDDTTSLETVHQNTITQISVFSGTKGRLNKYCTTGTDGLIAIWDA